ncbi:Integrase core domain protein [Tepidimonas sediminis]|uniref:Integrase core domain protein n=1 Tax=Tepidimonas sediminis TaxID=2588941 RepID=A0A554WEU9_9BURK|nr:DDE-type integrase/transposase/recombinase [Tepidimonas sediminis]TSE22087.1 Integrase core domain protein [Tepidimonas sediminis]
MVIDMNDSALGTIAQLRAFLEGTLSVSFAPLADDDARYAHIACVVRRFNYARLSKPDKGVVRRYLARTSGYSRPQLSRLLARVLDGAPLGKRYRAPAHAFARRYTAADVDLLVQVDRAHGCLSGPATAHLLRRAWHVHGDARFERLAQLSPSHLYNLRKTRPYQAARLSFTKTRTVVNAIGERRAPNPQGQAGFIRIDSVHQGDQDGIKGVYHINAVDILTQWEVVACCERISEACLLPVLEQLIEQFPFPIKGFHSDNGGEYINKTVAALLHKLHAEQTKSRPRKSNDNALAEGKNGSVVRKAFGYSHIPQRFAGLINAFCREHLNPYLNLHRPCLFAKEVIDAKGKVRKTYPPDQVRTPLEKLASLPGIDAKLRPGLSLEQLHHQALQMTDLQAAQALNAARLLLFATITKRSRPAA